MKLKKNKQNRMLIPVIVMLGVIPMIVHIFSYDSGLSRFDWFPDGGDMKSDFFFAWKMIALIITGAVMAGLLLYRHFRKRQPLHFDWPYYFLMFYALFVAMSALFSPYRRWTLTGSYDLFESVFVLFAYMAAVCYIDTFVNDEKQIYTVLAWSGAGAAIVTLIAAFQAFGMDFFKTTIGKMLITNPDSWGNLSFLNFTMAEGTSYTTLYNPNFLSFYFGMMIPLLACLFIAVRKLWLRIVLAIAGVLALVSLWGSRSDSGWMALLTGIGIVFLVLMSRTGKTRIIAGVTAAIGIAGAVVVLTQTSIGQKIVDTVAGTYHVEDYALKDIETGDDYVSVKINDRTLRLSLRTDGTGLPCVDVRDENSGSVSLTRMDDATFIDRLDDSAYGGATVQPVTIEEQDGLCFTIDSLPWYFVHKDDHYYLLNPAQKLVDYKRPAHVPLFKDDAMSCRGHIWNDTIPLLGKHLLVGSGANTFLFTYPQTDYIYNYYLAGGESGVVCDVKAHCWYLQQWVETGLLGTLALLAFIGIYLARSVSLYRKADLKDPSSWLGIGLFTAAVVYLVAAAANDSNVGTAPVFWVVLGLGIAVNRINSQKPEMVKQDRIPEEKLSESRNTGHPSVQTEKTAVSTSAYHSGKKKNRSKKKRK